MDPSKPLLTTAEVLRDGICVIEVVGRLDSHTSGQAQDAFIDATHRHPRVLIDCSRTTFMSSAGLRAIILGHRAARDAGGKFAVCIPTPAVMETVQVAAIDKVITITPTIEQALAQLKSPQRSSRCKE